VTADRSQRRLDDLARIGSEAAYLANKGRDAHLADTMDGAIVGRPQHDDLGAGVGNAADRVRTAVHGLSYPSMRLVISIRGRGHRGIHNVLTGLLGY
jgi:hypothetical protein